MCALSLVNVERRQREAFERPFSHGFACALRLSSFSCNLAALVEANCSPLDLVVEEGSLKLLECVNRSDALLITRVLQPR